MSNTLTLASSLDVTDLQTFLQRADRLGCDRVRIQVSSGVLIVTVCVLDKAGILDTHPFVFGVRTASVFDPQQEIDALLDTRALLDRLARGGTSIDLPAGQPRVAWVGSTPPRTGWKYLGDIPSGELIAVAQAGIDEVATANGLGTHIVTEVRRTVWSRNVGLVPAGVAFAGLGLGFITPAEDHLVRVTAVDGWLRATTTRGIVLVRA